MRPSTKMLKDRQFKIKNKTYIIGTARYQKLHGIKGISNNTEH